MRFHDLRHAVATTLLAEGTDVATVAMHLGHVSAVTTIRVYAHVLAPHDRKPWGDGRLTCFDESRLVHDIPPPHLPDASEPANPGEAVCVSLAIPIRSASSGTVTHSISACAGPAAASTGAFASEPNKQAMGTTRRG